MYTVFLVSKSSISRGIKCCDLIIISHLHRKSYTNCKKNKKKPPHTLRNIRRRYDTKLLIALEELLGGLLHVNNLYLFDLDGGIALGVGFQTGAGGHFDLGAGRDVERCDDVALFIEELGRVGKEGDVQLIGVAGVGAVSLIEVLQMGSAGIDPGDVSDNILIRFPASEYNDARHNQHDNADDPECLRSACEVLFQIVKNNNRFLSE